MHAPTDSAAQELCDAVIAELCHAHTRLSIAALNLETVEVALATGCITTATAIAISQQVLTEFNLHRRGNPDCCLDAAFGGNYTAYFCNLVERKAAEYHADRKRRGRRHRGS